MKLKKFKSFMSNKIPAGMTVPEYITMGKAALLTLTSKDPT
jgi:hypothetical protein